MATAQAALDNTRMLLANGRLPVTPAAVNRERRVVALRALAQAVALLRPYGRNAWTIEQVIREMDASGHSSDAAQACRLMHEAVRIAAHLPVSVTTEDET